MRFSPSVPVSSVPLASVGGASDASPTPFSWRRWTLLALAGPLTALLAWLGSYAPGFVERVFSRGLFPWTARIQTALQAWCPVSLAELLLYAAVPGLLLWAGRGLVRGRRAGLGFGRLAGRGALRFIALLSVVKATAMLLWGFHYRREPFAVQVGWHAGPSSLGELEALAEDLRAELVRLDAVMPRHPDGTLRLEDPWSLLRTAGMGYGRLPAAWTVHHSAGARPKRLLGPRLLSATLTAGIYAPWTGEAHVNGEVPACAQAFTACHELAHQKGFAREDEANFLGYAAAMAHPDPRFQYSATLAAFQEASGRLPAERRAALLKDLPKGVVADWRAERAFYQRHAGAVSHASQKVYAGYLKSQGQSDGLKSYGRFLDLMLAQRRAEGSR